MPIPMPMPMPMPTPQLVLGLVARHVHGLAPTSAGRVPKQLCTGDSIHQATQPGTDTSTQQSKISRIVNKMQWTCFPSGNAGIFFVTLLSCKQAQQPIPFTSCYNQARTSFELVSSRWSQWMPGACARWHLDMLASASFCTNTPAQLST